MAEVWFSNEKVADVNPQPFPDVGDVLELEVEGDLQPYTIDKIYKYYPKDADPVQRIDVSYSGPSFYGLIG